MVGKDPHRPEGKSSDAERMSALAHAKDKPYLSQADIAKLDRDQKEEHGGPSRLPAEEEIGGSRPGVPSRVKDALARLEGAPDED